MEIKEIYKFKGPIESRFKTAKEELDYYQKKNYSTFHIEKSLSARDSIIYFHENEKIEKIIFRGTRYIYNYDEDWNFEYVEKESRSKNTILFWEDLSFEVDQWQPQVVGKFGKEINFKFRLKNRTKEKQNLQLSTKDPAIRLLSSEIELLPFEEKFIPLKIKVNFGDGKKHIFFKNGKNKKFSFPFEVIGYDMDNGDFLSSYFYKNNLPFDIADRESVVIKLTENEKLLKIYHQGKLVSNHPISHSVNKVDLVYFEEGEYLFEIIDLKTNNKKYCRIVKEGAN